MSESDALKWGADGEAPVLDLPLEFRCRPGALRVRLPRHAQGYSPAALGSPSVWWTITALFGTATDQPAPINETGAGWARRPRASSSGPRSLVADDSGYEA
jgi:hypothetical protein